MNKTLLTLVAAAGMLGCARDVPVYTQRDVVQEVPGMGNFYKEVWSDAEQLKLSFYSELTDGTRPLNVSWSRYEAGDSTSCLKEGIVLNMRVDFPEQGIVGRVEVNLSDELCDGIPDACNGIYTPDSGAPVDVSEQACKDSEEAFPAIHEGFNNNFYNIDEQVNLWHVRKGL